VGAETLLAAKFFDLAQFEGFVLVEDSFRV
jgi:hypothetical protein